MVKDEFSENAQKAFLGFAAGVMIAASVWSLLIPPRAIFHQQNLSNLAKEYSEIYQDDIIIRQNKTRY